jgi:hypothetical protein
MNLKDENRIINSDSTVTYILNSLSNIPKIYIDKYKEVNIIKHKQTCVKNRIKRKRKK